MAFTSERFRRRVVEHLRAGGSAEPNHARRNTNGRVARPSSSDLSRLAENGDNGEFLGEAYRLILKREIDASGLLYYGDLLKNGVPRAKVLRQLMDSDEALELYKTSDSSPRRSTAGPQQSKRVPEFIRRTYYRAVGNVRQWIRIVLQIRQYELLLRKNDYLLHEFSGRFDRLSSKVDETCWAISAKLDAVREAISNDQQLLLARLDGIQQDASRSTTSLDRLQSEVKAAGSSSRTLQQEIQRLASQLAEQAAETRERLELIDCELHALRNAAAGDEAEMDGEDRSATRYLKSLSKKAAFSRIDPEELLGEFERVLAASEKAILAEVRQLLPRIHPPVFRGGDNVLVTETEGLILGVPGEEWRIASFLSFRGVLEPGLTALFRRTISEGMVVVDVGANVGLYTLMAARQVGPDGRVFSFEPTPRTFEILKDNIQVNGLLETGIIDARQIALADLAGTADFVTYRNNSGHNSLFGDRAAGDVITVPTVTLDEALAGQDRVDIVKIDAEGAEPLIIKGMRQTIERNPDIRIVIEFSPSLLKRGGVDPGAFVEQLYNSDFEIERIDDLTGDLHPTNAGDLTAVFSTNLRLTRRKAE